MRREISAEVYNRYLYRSHVTPRVSFLIPREAICDSPAFSATVGIIRGYFINFHSRSSSCSLDIDRGVRVSERKNFTSQEYFSTMSILERKNASYDDLCIVIKHREYFHVGNQI